MTQASRYLVNTPIEHDGQRLDVGSEWPADASDDAAIPLLACGALIAVVDAADEAAADKPAAKSGKAKA